MKWMFHSLTAGVVLTGLLALGACAAPSSRKGGFESDNPATLLYAIQEAGESGDRSKLPRLVESLENDDPAVRMMAMVALENITGERLGYRPYASSVKRAPAVARWQDVIRQGATDAQLQQAAAHVKKTDDAIRSSANEQTEAQQKILRTDAQAEVQ